MAGEEDRDAKEFDPSQRKLDRAREDGDAVRPEELQTAAATAGFLLALLAGGGWVIGQTGGIGRSFLDQPDRMSLKDGPALAGAVARMALPGLVLLVGAAVAVLIWLIVSRGIVFAPSRLTPKFSRLSVIANAGQKFGMQGLLDFGRRSLKMVVTGLILVLFLQSRRDEVFAALQLDAGQIALLMGRMLLAFLAIMMAVALVFGGLDFLIQRHQFLQRHRMTRKEMTDEMKDSEGDPHLKADRRRRAQEIATQQMLTDVPKADVVIVNPTHYAVALRWDRARSRAPVCVARGVDEMAARIRERAMAAGVPIRRDPPTARMLHAALQVGDEIRREHYAAVAAAIRFADGLRRRTAKGRKG